MHTIKITHNLLLEYQRTSDKFIRLLNRIEKNQFGGENRIKTFFYPNWNALLPSTTFTDTHTHTHTRLTALFRDYAGEPVPKR